VQNPVQRGGPCRLPAYIFLRCCFQLCAGARDAPACRGCIRGMWRGAVRDAAMGPFPRFRRPTGPGLSPSQCDLRGAARPPVTATRRFSSHCWTAWGEPRDGTPLELAGCPAPEPPFAVFGAGRGSAC